MVALRRYEQILDTNPLLRLVLPLMGGILFGDYFYAYFSEWHLLLFIVSAVSIISCIFLYQLPVEFSKKYFPFYTALSLAFFSLGTGLLVSNYDDQKTEWPDGALNLRVAIQQTPKESERFWQVVADVKGGDYDGKRLRLVLMKKGAQTDCVSCENKRDTSSSSAVMRVGDEVLVHAEVETPRNLGNPSEFDYALWLQRQGISGTAFCGDSLWKKADVQPASYSMPVGALRWRDYLVARYEPYFEGRDLAVLSAMTLGDKTRLDTGTRDLFSQTGVSHVLALSGLHLSILFMAFNALVISRCRRRWIKNSASIIGILGLWIFALLAGLPLSLVRAVVMFTVMQLMACLRHDSFSLNNMGLAALVLLIASPESLFDVGFQLSFASVLSILLLAGDISCPRWLQFSWWTRSLFGILVVSCCAQLGTAPLVAYYFHTFPVYNMVANCVAIPLTYGILFLTVLFFVLPVLQSFLAIVLGGLLAALEVSLSEISHWPGAVLELYPSVVGVVLTYVFVAFLVGYWLNRQTWRLYLSVISLIALASVEFYVHRPERLSPQIVFYNLRKVPAVHAIASCSHSYLWSSRYTRADSALSPVKRGFWKKEGVCSPQPLMSALKTDDIYYDRGILSFYGCRVGLCYGNYDASGIVAPLPVDYLLLARGASKDLSDFMKIYLPKVIVLDASLTDFYYKKYLQEAAEFSCEIYDMRKQGALVVNL